MLLFYQQIATNSNKKGAKRSKKEHSKKYDFIMISWINKFTHENIDKMDEGYKMIILREYNRVFCSVVDLI